MKKILGIKMIDEKGKTHFWADSFDRKFLLKQICNLKLKIFSEVSRVKSVLSDLEKRKLKIVNVWCGYDVEWADKKFNSKK